MSASPPKPDVRAPFTLVYAGNRQGPVNEEKYEDLAEAIFDAESVISRGELIIVRGFLTLRHKVIEVSSVLVTPD